MNKKKNIKNKSTIIIILFIIFLGGFIGSYSNANDCSIARASMDGRFKALDNWEYENILPKKAMQRALLNLKSFCCDPKIFPESSKKDSCTKDSRIKANGVYPSSVYLYDHILDVSMRRLDAKSENDNGADLIYGLDPDEKGSIWREFITKHANNKNGSIPLQISTKFKKTWEADEHALKARNPNYDYERLRDKEIKKYDKWNLASRYKGVCETSIYLYLKYPGGEKDKTRLNTAYKQCEKISNERIQKEFNYTKAVLMQKGNRLLYNNIKSYLDTYFSQNKLVALQQLVFNIKNTFNEINKAIPELVKDCN